MEKKRVTIKLKRPNPLFEKWISEWRDAARDKNSKMERCYSNALKSLGRYPLPIETGKDCIILQGFGAKLCQMLDDKLFTYKKQSEGISGTTIEVQTKIVKNKANKQLSLTQMLPIEPVIICDDTYDNPIIARKAVSTRNPVINVRKSVSPHNSKKVKISVTTQNNESNDYSPAYRSGAYAILITLYKDSLNCDAKGYMLKKEVIESAQEYSDKCFKKSETGGYYTAWSSMSTLISKGLVKKESNPAKFSLADAGIIMAHKLYKAHYNTNKLNEQTTEPVNCNINTNTVDENNEVVQNKNTGTRKKKFAKHASSSSLSSELEVETFIFEPNSFDIYLLVDTQETAGSSNKADDIIIHELESMHIKYEVRHLKVGDYLWVCRERNGIRELVLPYVVERKRIDDFGSSIKDGRFHEQKFRLKQSGLQNLIYMVESYNTKHTGLPLSTLQQAASNTLVQDGFSVKFTDHVRGSIEYLSTLTRIIIKMFKDKTLVSCPKKNITTSAYSDDLISLMVFKEFNQSSAKNKSFKVQELFIKQLLQLKGVSVDRALAIVEVYPTPRILQQKYCTCTQKEGENLLSGIQFGKLKKNVGAVISKTIYQLYSFKKF